MRARIAVLACLVACDRTAAPGADDHRDDRLGAANTRGPDDLAADLRTVVGTDPATRLRAVASWKLDEDAWRRTVVAPYRDAYADYVAMFDVAAPAIVDQLATAGEVTARRHFADDPQATGTQVRLRWAVPVLYPSAVATLGGAPLDTAFVQVGDHWGALLGAADIPLRRAVALDPDCAVRLAMAGAPGPCTDVGFLVADAAMRGDRAAFTRACGLAAAQCR